MTTNRTFYGLAPLALVLIALMASQAEARIIRSGGSIKGTDSFNHTVKLVDQSNINSVGLSGGNDYGSYSYNSFSHYVYATPAMDCHYKIEDTRDGFIRTDCDYEFDLGDRLQLQGFVEVFLNNSASYDIVWEIFQGTNSWVFSGSDTWLAEDDDPASDSDDIKKNIFLDAAMPLDMLAGDYTVALTFKQFAADGQQYFSYDSLREFYECEQHQVAQDEFEELCGQRGFASDVDSYTSYREDLHILATDVPEPPLFSLILAGFGAMSWRRIKRA
ncbi:hypothetical protein [Neptunicella sp.]|uniref:hypothetical protein n=1 Tax=Neptunicella sp. TaxID=2125986 RepID=UPI003F690694